MMGAIQTTSVRPERSRGAFLSLRARAPRLRSGRTGLVAAFFLLAATPALADSLLPPAPYANVQLRDPALERRAKALMETLRCLVCQGESIADSPSEMAGDMRSMVRQRILTGEDPESIRAWLISRYGQWVSYQPVLDRMTWPLFAAPFVLLLGGLWLARGRFRRRKRR